MWICRCSGLGRIRKFILVPYPVDISSTARGRDYTATLGASSWARVDGDKCRTARGPVWGAPWDARNSLTTIQDMQDIARSIHTSIRSVDVAVVSIQAAPIIDSSGRRIVKTIRLVGLGRAWGSSLNAVWRQRIRVLKYVTLAWEPRHGIADRGRRIVRIAR